MILICNFGGGESISMVSTQISNVNIELVYFLRANEQEMLDIWQEQIIVHKEEDSVELIRGNG